MSLTHDLAGELFDASQRKSWYKTILQAGKGGFGKVYLAKYSKDNGKVAVKRIPHVTPKQKRKNFQEIRFLKYCNAHSNIVKYIRSFLVKDEVWLVTEYMQGGTLTQVRIPCASCATQVAFRYRIDLFVLVVQAVAVHKFTESEIAYISREVLVALDYLHDNKLAHRDLKSGNIMLDMSGSVKLSSLTSCDNLASCREVLAF
jgi:serine/threonine protein kinase